MTSAAKSPDFFSMPLPTSYRTKRETEALLAFSSASTVCLSFFTKGCPSSVTSLRNFCTLPSTIFATMSAGFPDRSEEHTSELQSHRDLHSFPTRRSSDLLVVLHERLPEQRYFPEELLHASFHHFRNDVRGFPRLGGLGRSDAALLFDQVCRNIVLRQALGLGSGDVHGKIASELLVAAADVDQHADLPVVDVLRQPSLGLDPREAADRHVLADLAHERSARLLDRGTAERQRRERRHVRGVPACDPLGERVRELDEILALADEVGLAVDLHDSARAPVLRDVDRHNTFRRRAARGLRRLVAQPDAEGVVAIHVAKD